MSSPHRSPILRGFTKPDGYRHLPSNRPNPAPLNPDNSAAAPLYLDNHTAPPLYPENPTTHPTYPDDPIAPPHWPDDHTPVGRNFTDFQIHGGLFQATLNDGPPNRWGEILGDFTLRAYSQKTYKLYGLGRDKDETGTEDDEMESVEMTDHDEEVESVGEMDRDDAGESEEDIEFDEILLNPGCVSPHQAFTPTLSPIPSISPSPSRSPSPSLSPSPDPLDTYPFNLHPRPLNEESAHRLPDETFDPVAFSDWIHDRFQPLAYKTYRQLKGDTTRSPNLLGILNRNRQQVARRYEGLHRVYVLTGDEYSYHVGVGSMAMDMWAGLVSVADMMGGLWETMLRSQESGDGEQDNGVSM
ncbi:hypothetical protein JAAARDRAFT_198656 [Jaapia argillacea MUCL 33604]|uniref:Uncharacterized protein n=1 Tax=Jaapia argillacea MUCL 33604 TaxID=933084 RepID=A0A067PB88_9AGAM|nr:hypothetical protein JAAARDRAFT_198656 [Jaapia argillacea MUCL 33604]